MKNFATLFLFILVFAFVVKAQQVDVKKLSGHNWAISEDVMTGIGTHRSLDSNILLQMDANGKWKSSHEMRGYKSGSWAKNANRKVMMQFGDGKEAEIVFADDDHLTIVVNNTTNKVTWKWIAPK